MIGQAQTGSGKTAAFGLPMLDYIDPENEETQAIVLTPTRELCIQVTQALRAYAEHLEGVNVVAVFGGAPIREQQSRLRHGAQVVVATVGRMMDLISRQSLVLTAARYVVLDEADEMLDLGFIEDVEKILRMCPSGRQTLLFSATMPAPVARLAETYMYDPVTIRVTPKKLTVDSVEQAYVMVEPRKKLERLAQVLKAEEPEQAIIFVRTKIGASTAGQGPRRQGAAGEGPARRPQPGPARRGDDLLQGAQDAAAGGHRHRGAGPRHRARHPRHQLRPAEQPRDLRPPDRAHRTGRQDRPGDHLRHREAGGRPEGDRADGEGADRRVGAARGAARARPDARDTARAPARSPRTGPSSCSSTAASAAGLTEEDLSWALTEGAVLPEDAIHSIRVLDRFSFVEVAADQAERAVEYLDGTKLKGKQIRMEIARSLGRGRQLPR